MKSIRCIVVSLILVICVIPGFSQDDQERAFLNVYHSISSHAIRNYVAELSSDKYKGRLTGSPEYMDVANWVADNLKEWGVKPGGDNGTYLQMFDKPYVEVADCGSVSLSLEGKNGARIEKQYVFADDYYPGTNSATGSVTAEVVYVGYGITAPDLKYDDYAKVDVSGKIVMVTPEMPFSGPDDEKAKWVPYSLHQHKLDNAAKHGAIGVLYVNPIANPNTSYNEGLVYCHINKDVAEDVLFGTGKSYKALIEKTRKNLKPASFVTKNSATITTKGVYHPEGRGCNVIGLIEGTDPILKNEVVIVGGHLDGVGYLGEVLPGALDNASGIADILAAAKAMAASPVPLKRTVMFLFIGGEECNLLGSRHYTKYPKFSKEKTVAFFNIDMAGTGSGLSVGGAASYPRILKCFEEANSRYIHRPFRVSKERGPGVTRPRSDSVIFKRAGFRTLSFGTFYQEGETRIRTYYHHPLDNMDTISPPIMEDVAKLIFVGLTSMANTDVLID